MFFFPEYKLNVAMQVVYDHQDELAAKQALKEFNYQCRRFLGLNYFLSFIPDTKAYDARIDFNDAIENIVDEAHELIDYNKDFFDRISARAKLHGPIANLLLLGPIWDIFQFSAVRVRSHGIFYNTYISLENLYRKLPIINDFYYSNSLENLLHTLLNPVRILSQTATFAWLLINRILEIPTFSQVSNFLVATLKGVNGLIFALAALPLKALETVCDIPYQILKHVVFKPLKFIGSSMVQAFKTSTNKTTVKLPEYEYNYNINNASTNQISLTLGFNPQANNQNNLYEGEEEKSNTGELQYARGVDYGDTNNSNNNNNYDYYNEEYINNNRNSM